MNAMHHIRKVLFDLNQVEFAAIANVSQGTVSRWESGHLEPNRSEMALIRKAAKERKLDWNDAIFFPSQSEERAA